ncbi:hypothetical protein DPMN_125248 [Dreissena polymorpha]|uniref:Uncharacterized protein n=1 Tax=Dreissena polymorpha TaxID=45954 RepID=A0A9D4GU34_DREPO|nr:hypothetical protein DPMN_125248 [Dreissena polymorpha]
MVVIAKCAKQTNSFTSEIVPGSIAVRQQRHTVLGISVCHVSWQPVRVGGRHTCRYIMI